MKGKLGVRAVFKATREDWFITFTYCRKMKKRRDKIASRPIQTPSLLYETGLAPAHWTIIQLFLFICLF